MHGYKRSTPSIAPFSSAAHPGLGCLSTKINMKCFSKLLTSPMLKVVFFLKPLSVCDSYRFLTDSDDRNLPTARDGRFLLTMGKYIRPVILSISRPRSDANHLEYRYNAFFSFWESDVQWMSVGCYHPDRKISSNRSISILVSAQPFCNGWMCFSKEEVAQTRG